MTVLCNGKLKESAIVTCTENIGWVGGADWIDLDCRFKGIVVNTSGNSTGNSTGNTTARTGVFRQNNGFKIIGNPVFIIFCVMYILSVLNIYLKIL